MLRLLSKWLERAGYSVQCAGDGQQALVAIESDCPDILVTDWEMPNVNGLELCRRVRRLDLPHYVYIVFLTVKSSHDEMIAGLQIGADDFLRKPVREDELVARMRSGARVLELERQLSQMARTDPLTGLMTQRTFYEALEREWHRTARFHLPLSCVMMDIDFFKRVNDIHGHPAGDTVLKVVAELLTNVSRNSDSVSRYGGEEFCVMLPETTEENAVIWAERARKRLAALQIVLAGKEIRITGSFGVSQQSPETQNGAGLVDQADQALLCAKQSGRDRVVRYGSLNEENDVDLEASERKGGLFHGVAAKHVMAPVVVCLREDETVGQAAEFFLRSRINSTPVVAADGRLVGVLSEKDLLAAVASLDCWQRPVRDVMKPNVICYDEETPIRAIYEFLCRVSIRRIVVVKDGRPTGTIGRGTLLRWFRNLVISKGLLQDHEVRSIEEDLDPHRSKERLAETARELAHQASELQSRFGPDEAIEDLVPYVVGGVTGMQELVNDLLAYSRYANQSAGLTPGMYSMMLDGGQID
ncbi:MAG: diguanylate cyclase [Pirellulales bacterium]|nr:diguanylate cyclase [Pirellulales bacterium]